MELRDQHDSFQRKLHKGVRNLKHDNSRRMRRMAKEIQTKSDNGCDRFSNYMSRELTTGLMTTYRKFANFIIEKEEAGLAKIEEQAIRDTNVRDILASLADVILTTAQNLTNVRLEDQRDARAEVLRRTIHVSGCVYTFVLFQC